MNSSMLRRKKKVLASDSCNLLPPTAPADHKNEIDGLGRIRTGDLRRVKATS
jgi:hypothetical protein